MADGILWQLVGGVGKDWVPQFQQGYDRGEQQAIKSNRRSVLEQLATGPDGNLDAKAGLTQLIRAGDLQGAAQFAQTAKILQPESTDELKEYRLDQLQRQQAGLPPRSFFDYKSELRRAGSTKITNSIVTGDNQYSKTLGENDAKGYIDINKAGAVAQGKLNTLSALDNLMKDPNFYSGAGGDTVKRLRSAAVSLGIENPKVASSTEVFDALSKKFVLDLAGGSLGTGFSNADRDFLQGQVPTLQNTPDGNARLIQYMRAVAQREQQVAALARRYASQNKGRYDQAGFSEYIANWAEQNPLFPQSNSQRQPPQSQPQNQQRTPSAQQRPARVPVEGDIIQNGQGERRQFRGGQWVPVQ